MAERSRPTRQAAERRGRSGETLAALALRLKGYRILARRVRTPLGEIDLITRRGGLLAIIEVKARPSLAEALEAVTPRAQQRIARAADAWCARRAELALLDRRFDVIAVRPWRWPVHIRDAWRPDFALTGV